MISFTLSLQKTPATAAGDVLRRKWSNFVAADFEADLSVSRLCGEQSGLEDFTPEELASLYEEEMTSLLDRHAPRVRVKRKQCKLTPWFDAECREARRHTRAGERRY